MRHDWVVALVIGDRRPVRRSASGLTEDAARALYRDLCELGARRPGIGGAELLRLRQRGGLSLVDSVRFDVAEAVR